MRIDRNNRQLSAIEQAPTRLSTINHEWKRATRQIKTLRQKAQSEMDEAEEGFALRRKAKRGEILVHLSVDTTKCRSKQDVIIMREQAYSSLALFFALASAVYLSAAGASSLGMYSSTSYGKCSQ